MENVFAIIGAVIGGLGGASVIILGLSSWLGKVWANSIFEKEKVKYAKELEGYKGDINKEILRLKTLDEKTLHITKIQYQKEFEIYQEIWRALVEVVWATTDLFPIYEEAPTNEIELEEFNKIKYEKYVDKYNKFFNNIRFNAPFYQEEFYIALENIRVKCEKMGDIFKDRNIVVKYSDTFAMGKDVKIEADEKMQLYITLIKEIRKLQGSIEIGIRDYLKKLRVE